MFDLFFQIGPWLILLPLCISFLPLKSEHRLVWTLRSYLVVSALSQFIAFALWYLKMNNMPVLHVYTLLEFTLIGLFYYFLLRDFPGGRIILYVIAGFDVLSILNSVFIQDIYHFNSYASALRGFIIVCFALLYIFKSLDFPDSISKISVPACNWINSGYLVYFSGALILFAFNDILPKERIPQLYVWSVHVFLLVVLYIFLSIGLWKLRRI